jgi:general secretion pathway protein A
MYESFFGFRERPFDLTPNPKYLVLTDVHREALSNLEYAIAGRKGITVLIGEAGSGKTTLIRTAIARQPERVHCVHVQNPALTREEFVETLAERFGLSQLARTSKAALLSELELLLRRRAQVGETTVLIVDEAQSLPIDLLEELRLLVNIETNERKLLSMILAGQPELALRLNEEGLRQLKQRVELRCELRPLTVLETTAYIAGRIRAAGGQGARVFTREAVMLIHEGARGIPRTVNVLADNALLSGFALQHRPVTRQLVAEVCRDFDLRAQGGLRDVQRNFTVQVVLVPLEEGALHRRTARILWICRAIQELLNERGHLAGLVQGGQVRALFGADRADEGAERMFLRLSMLVLLPRLLSVRVLLETLLLGLFELANALLFERLRFGVALGHLHRVGALLEHVPDRIA